MLGKTRWLSGLLVLSVALAALPALAQKPDEPAKGKFAKKGPTEEEQKQEHLNRLLLAYQLAEYGRTAKAPEALVTAGGMLRQLPPLGTLKEEPTLEPDPDAPKGEAPPKVEAPKSLREQADELFKEARKLAPDDKGVEALIKTIEDRPAYRGALGGPRTINRGLPPGATHTWTIPFAGNHLVRIGLRSNGPLRVHVYGPGGSEIASDTCVVGQLTWMPRQNAQFTVRVRNVSGRFAVYTLFTN